MIGADDVVIVDADGVDSGGIVGSKDQPVDIGAGGGTVTVEGGIPLWQLNDELETRDLALANLGDIDRQSISGAIALIVTAIQRRRRP